MGKTFFSVWSWLALAGLVILSACTTATVAPPTAAPAQPSATQPKATQLPAPTATAAATLPPTQAPTLPPTETLAPTATPVAATPAPTLGFADSALAGWCVEPDTLLLDSADPTSPPANARVGKSAGKAFQIDNLPSNGCMFLYTFNQPAPAGLKLAIYDLNQKTPWLQAELKPVSSKPNTVAVVLRHTYIIAPPVWKVSFNFAVLDAGGKELRRDQVNLNRWTPGTCWNGQPPNVFTLRCPLAEDLHPWDPSYGTPIPTLIPPGGFIN